VWGSWCKRFSWALFVKTKKARKAEKAGKKGGKRGDENRIENGIVQRKIGKGGLKRKNKKARGNKEADLFPQGGWG